MEYWYQLHYLKHGIQKVNNLFKASSNLYWSCLHNMFWRYNWFHFKLAQYNKNVTVKYRSLFLWSVSSNHCVPVDKSKSLLINQLAKTQQLKNFILSDYYCKQYVDVCTKKLYPTLTATLDSIMLNWTRTYLSSSYA